jgi:probable F420-dependent oxidoreductase
MHVAIGYFATCETVGPATLARLVEARGFESLFLAEHTHIPSIRSSPWPPGGELPPQYSRTFDPLLALTAAATATTTLGLGTGVSLLAQRDPIVTAKAVATLDHLSGGRVLLGTGAGWNLEEMRNHGVDPETRFSVLREHVEAMKAIWMSEQSSYHGRHVNFDGIWSWPKPVQSPHPPILIGGNGSGAPARVLRYGDEWFPSRVGSDEDLIARIRSLAEDGKPTTLTHAPHDPKLLERYAAAGTRRILWWLPPGDADAAEQRLDRLAQEMATL